MSSNFCLTIRFLDPVPSFHGRGDGDEPEWPPSPLRIYQALVAATAARRRVGQFADEAQRALKWLELQTPMIVAPVIQGQRTGYRMYVPNNAGDLVTSAWARGNTDAKFSSLNVEKDVRPTRLVGGECVNYLWPLTEPITTEVQGHVNTLSSVARSITHLGWGIDMVAGNAAVITDDDVAKLPGERWRSAESGGTSLRIPVEGTLAALADKHEAFLNRLGPSGFKPVPPLTAFKVLGYRRDCDPVKRPFVAYRLLHPETGETRSYSATNAIRVAGMIRGAAGKGAMLSLDSKHDDAWVEQFVYGHKDCPDALPRFSYLPLPSIQPVVGVGRIRRVLIAEPLGASGHEVAWIKRLLSGATTKNEQARDALLVPMTRDPVLSCYVNESETWTTVTPVALPGCDEGKAGKTDKLLEKMFRHAGYSTDMVADLEYNRVPFLRGAEDARRYRPGPPHYLAHCSMYHMRIRWKHPMPGPIALGSGRFCGLGLFAAIS